MFANAKEGSESGHFVVWLPTMPSLYATKEINILIRLSSLTARGDYRNSRFLWPGSRILNGNVMACLPSYAESVIEGCAPKDY
jgi:hypothetical protein